MSSPTIPPTPNPSLSLCQSLATRSEAMTRERPRTMYATAHRSDTDTPFLSLRPVIYSLTDGTTIPPPIEQEEPRTTPTYLRKYSPFPSPASYAPQSIFTNSQTSFTNRHTDAATLPNPLSFHPVSPFASPSSTTTGPTFSSVGTPSESSFHEEESSASEDDGDLEDDEYGDEFDGNSMPLAVLRGRRNTYLSTTATVGNRASTIYQWRDSQEVPDESMLAHQQQRPRFVERFFRMKSANSIPQRRTQTKSEYFPNGPEGYSFEGDERFREERFREEKPRVVRRTMSYNSTNLLNANKAEGKDSVDEYTRRGYGANTFPRMVRKKSMDLFSSAKRASGNWWMKDQGTETGRAWGSGEGDQEEEPKEDEDDADVRTIIWEPAPSLPDLSDRLDGGKLGAEEMFGRIGLENEFGQGVGLGVGVGEGVRPRPKSFAKRLSNFRRSVIM